MKRTAALAAFGILVALLAALFLTSCDDDGGPPILGDGGTDSAGGGSAPGTEDTSYERTPPPVVLAEYAGQDEDAKDDGARNGAIDKTNISKGYIGAYCTAPVRAKVQVSKGDPSNGERDEYDLDSDGTVSFYPLTRGDGDYTVTLYLFVEDTPQGPAYEAFIVATFSVAMESQFAPYLVPNRLMNYSADSECVKLSHEITRHSKTDLEVVQQIYGWIADNVDYDTSKAEDVLAGYVFEPDPDETLRLKTGICYDYASLAGAMLRANGIPTKMVKGDVYSSEDGTWVYHAWNLVWLEETGWIAVDLEAVGGDWNRIDTTFASAGAGMGSFIGDGNNYTPMSEH